MNRQTLNLSITIQASKEKVWKVLLQDETYRIWASVFMEGSYAETDDWKEGSRVLFKSPEGDGLISRVELHKPYEAITIEHLGVLVKGEEDFEGEEAKKWKGTKESYFLTEKGAHVQLTIEQVTDESYIDWFNSTWEKALEKIKDLSEQATVTHG
ncbi:SRPBCC domain-containing protein [Rapidithrix thailandica]|uniref:SRPBCC domain-containing protein n=1 Tax=Rapidithrix thailandica TaxID=413964 RepID=A0AAW9SCD3_9BACT